jgi:glyceraldehyde-3-phosphate dehydrogenase (NADP+)
MFLVKLPKQLVLAHYPLLNGFKKAFPAETNNTLYGREGVEIIYPLIGSTKVNVLAFIEFSHVPNIVNKSNPKTSSQRSMLRLDAINTTIVANHADLDVVVNGCLLSTLFFNG